jgi:hypothetical protein
MQTKHSESIRTRLQEAQKSIDALKKDRRPERERHALIALWAAVRALADESEVPPTTEPVPEQLPAESTTTPPPPTTTATPVK